MLPIVTALTAASAALPAAQAIVVSPDSPCAVQCGNVGDSTSPDDINCDQDAYSGDVGSVYKDCLECELRSGYSHGNQSDVQWTLYNFRYAVSYCLFGNPDNDNIVSTPCSTEKACEPYQKAIEFKNLSTQADSFDYCALWPTDLTVTVSQCTDCLRPNNQYLANFMTVLEAGCEQQPATGVTLGIDGDPFSTEQVNITAPTPTASVDPDWFEHGPLTLPGKVGIGIAGFAFILMVLGCGIVWNGKRRRRAFLRSLGAKYAAKGWPSPTNNNQSWPSPNHQGEMFQTPASPSSQRPLRGWDDSPMTAHSEATFPRYFSPYSSHFNSPVSAADTPSNAWHHVDAGQTPNIGVALSSDELMDFPNSPEKNGASQYSDSYEMQRVEGSSHDGSQGYQRDQEEPPILNHPGYGRNHDNPSKQYELGHEDAIRGRAF